MFKKSLLFLTVILIITGCATSNNKNNLNLSPTKIFDIGSSSDNSTAGNLETVNFPINSDQIIKKDLNKLAQNIRILEKNNTINIQLEGHCDERGGPLFNIKLGKKRAQSIKKMLIDEGISSTRISTISFGKEKPIDFTNSVEGWKENRRVNLVLSN